MSIALGLWQTNNYLWLWSVVSAGVHKWLRMWPVNGWLSHGHRGHCVNFYWLYDTVTIRKSCNCLKNLSKLCLSRKSITVSIYLIWKVLIWENNDKFLGKIYFWKGVENDSEKMVLRSFIGILWLIACSGTERKIIIIIGQTNSDCTLIIDETWQIERQRLFVAKGKLNRATFLLASQEKKSN